MNDQVNKSRTVNSNGFFASAHTPAIHHTHSRVVTHCPHPHTKIFATLSMAAATGKKIQIIGFKENDKKAKLLGRDLQLAGKYATKRYPSGEFTPQKIMDVYDSVTALVSGPTEPTAILSMLLAGLSDISAKADKKRRKLIDQVSDCAQKCLDMYPIADIDHDEAWAQYCRWVS